MSALFDISHPAHAHFFLPLAHDLSERGIGVRIVARDKDVTVPILKAAGLPFNVLPMSRPGAGRIASATELQQRSRAIRRLIRTSGTRVVLTRNPSGVLAALGTSATSIFDTDDGRSVGAHYWAARPFADIITSSEFDPEDHGVRHRRYRALKAQMFLRPERFTPDPEIRRRYVDHGEDICVARFSAHDASHDNQTRGISPQGRRAVLERLQASFSTLVSIEREGLILRRRSGASVPVAPEDFHHLLGTAVACVGDSQSVAAEAALLGVPAIRLSSFSDRTFYLALLERQGLMQNFLPGQEEALLEALDELLLRAQEARAVAQQRSAAFARDTRDLRDWYLDLVLEVLESG